MTHTPKERAIIFSRLNRRIPELMQQAFQDADKGAISWDADAWDDMLDWVSGPLAKMILWSKDLPPEKRGEHHPMYGQFEMFARAKLPGGPFSLKDPKNIRFMWAVLRMYVELELRALVFFKVRYSAVELVDEAHNILQGEPPALEGPGAVPVQRPEP
jgi:hypothetical protein